MSPRAPLPARILIPVANPATAEDLVRIGAEIMDPRTGELTVLGIVEVPEDVALSDGATQARQARRLLQKVLDYAPQGTRIRPLVRIGRRAAEGIVEAATEVDADLLIFGWGGRPGGRGRRRPAPSSRRRSTPSSASRPATSPSSSSARSARSGGSSSRSAAAPTPSSPWSSPTPSPAATTPGSSSST